MNMQFESGFDDPTLLPWRPLEPGEIIEKGDEFYNDYECKWNEILSFIGDEYIVKEWNTPLRTRRKPVQGEALTLSIGGVRPAGKQPESALAQKLKAALPCPWNHQPMWVINGDWDNPNVKCSVPSCPAYKQDVTLEQWNNRDGGVPEPTPKLSAVEDFYATQEDGWPYPDYTKEIKFEGCDRVVIAPEDYRNLYNKAYELAVRCDAAEAERDELKKAVTKAQEYLRQLNEDNAVLRARIDAMARKPIEQGIAERALAMAQEELAQARESIKKLENALNPFITLNPRSHRVLAKWDDFICRAKEAIATN
jgi:hypothetical protein